MPVMPILPSINTCMSLTTTTSTTTNSKVPEVNTSQLQALAEVCSTVTGAEPLANLSNLVMNSLVSPTKVVTNDSLPNPIVSASISLPAFPVPISSIGIPLLTMKNEDIDSDSDNLSGTKKDEPMPVEEQDDDSVLQMAAQIEENIAEIDEDGKNAALDLGKDDKIVANGTGPEKMAVVENNFALNNTTEPMECVPTSNALASPKHIILNDVNMLESISVCLIGKM